MSPVEPMRTQPFAGDQRHNDPADAPTEMHRAVPRPVDLPRNEGSERTLPPPIELPQAAVPDELPPPIELRPESSMPTPPVGALPPPVELRRPEPPETPEEQTLVHKPIKLPPDTPPEPVAEQRQAALVPESVEASPAFAQERLPEEADEDPDELPPSALSIATPSISRPSPRRRPKPKDATRPRLVPASKDSHGAAFGDEILNTQERNLLRELQDELARRENQEQGSTSASSWSGRHGRPGDSARANSGPVIINGTSPNQEGRGYPPAT